MVNPPRKSREVEALKKLAEEVERGSCRMPILLYGEEEYRLEEARRRLVKAALPDKADRVHGVETVTAKEVDLAGVIQRATGGSLFAARQVLVVRDAQLFSRGGGEDEDAEAAPAKRKKAKAGVADSNPWELVPLGALVILMANPGMDRRTRVFKQIEASGRLLACDRMKREDEVLAWADDYLERRFKKSMSPAARSLLWRRIGGESVSLMTLSSDLTRLALYAADRGRIEAEDIDALVERSGEEVVFDLARAITGRKRNRALALLGEFLARGEAPVLLVSLLGRELRTLLEARILLDEVPSARKAANADFGSFRARFLPAMEAEANAKRPGFELKVPMAGGNPWGFYLALQAAAGLSREELLRGLGLAARADRELKSSGRPDRLVFETLILRMTEVA